MEGYPFTWTNGRRAVNPTEERLDRAMASQSWLDEFPQFKFINAIADRSDHSPVLLRLTHREREFTPRIFKFENAWLEEQDLHDIVHNAWIKDGCAPLLSKIKGCSEDLEEWGSRLRTRFKNAIAEYREEMRLNQDSREELCVKKYNEARDNLSKVLKQEDDYWRQRSKTHWLRDGDSNTKFFHAMATSRKKRNGITKLQNSDGDIINDQQGLCATAKEYFDSLFKCSDNDDGEVTNLLIGRVTEEDNRSLTEDFRLEEFKSALFSMHADKAPGPDGMNPAFYKHFWDMCGHEVF
jgi:hypothetical protein